MCFLNNSIKEASLKEILNLIKFLEDDFGLVKESSFSDVNISKQEEKKEKKEELNEYSLQVISIPEDKKISLLKFVKNFLEIGLKESKSFIDSLPKTLKKTSSKEELETLQKQVESLGAKTSIV